MFVLIVPASGFSIELAARVLEPAAFAIDAAPKLSSAVIIAFFEVMPNAYFRRCRKQSANALKREAQTWTSFWWLQGGNLSKRTVIGTVKFLLMWKPNSLCLRDWSSA